MYLLRKADNQDDPEPSHHRQVALLLLNLRCPLSVNPKRERIGLFGFASGTFVR